MMAKNNTFIGERRSTGHPSLPGGRQEPPLGAPNILLLPGKYLRLTFSIVCHLLDDFVSPVFLLSHGIIVIDIMTMIHIEWWCGQNARLVSYAESALVCLIFIAVVFGMEKWNIFQYQRTNWAAGVLLASLWGGFIINLVSERCQFCGGLTSAQCLSKKSPK